MQLKRKRAGHVRQALATFSATLLAGGIAGAHDEARAQGPVVATPSQVDAAVLIYQEQGGRVRAIEPTLGATLTGSNGGTLTFGVLSDTLTGASPNGAVPSINEQTFITPLLGAAATGGGTVTVSGASGGSVVVQLPGQSGFVRQYTVAPGELPIDKGFKDDRRGGHIGWSQPFAGLSKIAAGFAYSSEFDYESLSGNASVAQEFNNKNTTLSLGANFESNTISPYGGVPTPLTAMSGALKGPDETKKQLDVVLGATQLLNRYWLVQANYSYGRASGYQNDPYRIISKVDPINGAPIGYAFNLYENRPDSRLRHSLYVENKVSADFNVVTLSLRYYTDDWGIDAVSAELSDRIAIMPWLYVEPKIRWYRQSAADFFRHFLINGQAVPEYASSDVRLAKFTALTYGMKAGFQITPAHEVYVRGEYYVQSGEAHPAAAFGQLLQHDLFSGVTAVTFMTGYTWVFDGLW